LSADHSSVGVGPPTATREPKPQNTADLAAAHWDAEIGSIRVLFGEDRCQEAGTLVDELGCRRVLLVSDPGIRQAGHLRRLQDNLTSCGLAVRTFDRVDENPTCRQVDEGVAEASPFAPDCIVALGGGSAMDCAKGINFLLTNGGRMADYWGFGRATQPLLPSIGIPTTAGTGSEAQSYALICDDATHRKMACGDSKARFRAVILDPNLTASAPHRVAAAAGLDAVSHAVETYVSTRRNPVSQMLALTAWKLLEPNLERSLEDGASAERRGKVLLAAHLAGAAIEQSMLGAAHAGANPLTAVFGITHGQAVSLLLPHVVRFNAEEAESGYLELMRAAGLESPGGAGETLAARIEQMRGHADLPSHLRQIGVSASELSDLAAAAALEWTGRFNPRPVGEPEFLALYETAF
jgi:alcohol dehydrogenase